MSIPHEYRLRWYQSFHVTAIEDDPAQIEAIGSVSAADLRHALVDLIRQWQRTNGQDFTLDEMQDVIARATADLPDAVSRDVVLDQSPIGC